MGKCRHHAFISYAWADNQSFGAAVISGQGGGNQAPRNDWISVFHGHYYKHLGREIGRIPEDRGELVWLDYEQLRGNHAVTPGSSTR